MLVSPRNSCAGYGEGWAGALGLLLPRGQQGSPGVLPCGVPWALPASPTPRPRDGAFSPWVLFMCFEDHFCIVRSEEKIF